MSLTPEHYQAELLLRELARRSYPDFVPYLKRDYLMQPFHHTIALHLQWFAEKKFTKLMVTMPPQHGKSELSTRSFPPFLFGLNPSLKIAVLSYGASKAKKFNREIQQRMGSPAYQCLFPGVRLPSARDEAATKTSTEFDVIGGVGGSLKAVGRKGGLTGDPVDVVILDDLLKDRAEAQSLTIRENTWDWIVDVVETRLHNESQMLYVTTRWDEDDPAGRFLDRDGYYSPENPAGWILLNFPALKTADINRYDNRERGQALWPQKHSQERMEEIRKNNPLTFNALYQGDPKPSPEAMVFADWVEIEAFPHCDTVFYALDFGFTNDPTALVKIGRIGPNLYLEEVLYQTHLTNPDILEHFHAAGLDPSLETICDKAEPKSIEELVRGSYNRQGAWLGGINARGCEKGPGSINAGILKLKEFTVHYTKQSRNIKREKDNYQWIMAGGKATNTPIDAYNHALDAIRSAVFTKYNKPEVTGNSTFRTIPVPKGRFDDMRRPRDWGRGKGGRF